MHDGQGRRVELGRGFGDGVGRGCFGSVQVGL